MKRIISLLLTVIMIVQMLPLQAFAQDLRTQGEETQQITEQLAPELPQTVTDDAAQPEEEITAPPITETPQPDQQEQAYSTMATGTNVASGTCGAMLSWVLTDDGTLTISGTGAMTNFVTQGLSDNPWDNYSDQITNVVIKNGVTTIGNGAFSWFSALESVTIPSSVTSIGEFAFGCCFALTSITIPDSVTSIGEYAFYNTPLASLKLPSALKTIGSNAFEGCAIQSVTIPGGVTSMGSSLFFNCTSLASVTVAEGVTAIDDGAFNGCYAQTIVLPSTLKTIGSNALAQSGITAISIPAGVTAIGTDAFHDCDSLESVTIPAGVTVVKESTFYDCGALTDVVITEGVTTIESYAFAFCESLETVTLPESLATIDMAAFNKDNNLTTVNYAGSESQWNAISIGTSNDPLTNAQIVYGKQDTPVETVIASGACGESLNWTQLDTDADGTGDLLVISGTGAMTDFSAEGAPWYDTRTDITDVIIEEGVTSIGDYAFYYCGQIETVEIPDSVQSIGSDAFNYCRSLKSVAIPYGVTTIEAYTFYECAALESVSIPDTVEIIEERAFFNCSALEEITLPKSLRIMARYALAGTAIKSVVIPSGVTNINDYTFSNCKSLESVTFPRGLRIIGYRILTNCTALTDIYFEGSYSYWNSVSIDSSNSTWQNSVTYHFGAIKVTCTDNGTGKPQADKTVLAGGETVTFSREDDGYERYFDFGYIVGGQPISGNTYTQPEGYTSDEQIYVEFDRQLKDGYIAAGGSGSTMVWGLTTDGTLDIYGRSTMVSYSSSNAPWYEYRNLIKKVVLDNRITTISEGAFRDCTALESITFGDKIYKIDNAFENCPALTDIYYNGLATEWSDIEKYDADYLDSLVNIVLRRVTTSYSGVGGGRVEADKVKVSNGETVTLSITPNEGYVVRKITVNGTPISGTEFVAEFGDSTEDILVNVEFGYPLDGTCGDLVWTFDEESGLLTVTGNGPMPNWNSTSYVAWKNYTSQIKQVEIAEGVTSVGNSAFCNATELVSVTLPQTITYIGTAAFSGCEKLESIEIPESVQTIGASAFSECKSIKEITIPDGIETIDSYTFEWCTSLEKVTVPASVKTVGHRAFENSDAISEVYYDGTVTQWKRMSIDYYSTSFKTATRYYGVIEVVCKENNFGAVYADKNEIKVAETVAFTTDISSLSEYFDIYFTLNDEEYTQGSFTAAYSTAGTITAQLAATPKDGYIYAGKAGENAHWYLTTDGTFTVTGTGAMDNPTGNATVLWKEYRDQIKNAVIEDGITNISDFAFYSCPNLETVIIPDSVTTIGRDSFYGTSLTAVYYGGTKTQWDAIACGSGYYYIKNPPRYYKAVDVVCTDNLFGKITADKAILNLGETVFFTNENSPIEKHYNIIFKVDENEQTANSYTLEDYSATGEIIVQLAGQVKDGYIAQGTCGENNMWLITEGGKLIISGTGNMKNYSSTNQPWHSYKDIITAIEVEEGITNISSYAFYKCVNAETIDLPSTITIIEYDAFDSCKSVKSIEIPYGVERIGSYAFDECTALESIVIPDSVTYMDSYTFQYCSSLKTIQFSKSLTAIPNYAFRNCTALEEVTIPDNITSIASYAFAGCVNAVIHVPATLIGTSEGMFNGVKRIEYAGSPQQWQQITENVNTGITADKLIAAENWQFTYAINSDGNVTITGADAVSAGILVIPKRIDGRKVTAIADNAFSGNTDVAGLIVNADLEYIGKKAFYNTKLATIEFNGSLRRIEENAFYNAVNFKSSSSSAVTANTIVLPEGIEFIGRMAFAKTSTEYNQVKLLSVPLSVQSIEKGAFSNLSISKIEYSGTAQQWIDIMAVESLSDYRIQKLSCMESDFAFAECKYDNGLGPEDAYALMYANFKNGEVVIPDQFRGLPVRIISALQMVNADMAVSVTVPRSVKEIDWNFSFEGCTNLTTFRMYCEIYDMPSYMFSGCTALETVYLPHSLRSINYEAFKECFALTDVYFDSRYNWENYVTVYSGNLVLDDVTMHFAHDWGYEITYHWISDENQEKSIIITGKSQTDGLLDIPSEIHGAPVRFISMGRENPAFENRTDITEVIIPATVYSVEYAAFRGCTNLEKITVSEETYLQEYTFAGCTSLKEMVFLGGRYNCYIDETVFEGVPRNANITIGSDSSVIWELERMGFNIFNRVVILSSIIVPEKLSVPQGSTAAITAKLNPTDATANLVWQSADETIATVSSKGVVTGIALGQTTITVTDTETGKTASTLVTVNLPATSKLAYTLAPQPDTIGLQTGKTTKLELSATDFGPVSADMFEFTSSDETLATVDENGVITAVNLNNKSATVKITAKLKEDAKKRLVTVSVKVIPLQTENIEVSAEGESTEEGVVVIDAATVKTAPHSFLVTVLATTMDGVATAPSIKWTTSNSKVAAIKNGVVTIPKGADGIAVITATVNDLKKTTATITIDVRNYVPRMDKTSVTLNSNMVTGTDIVLTEAYSNTVQNVWLEGDDRFLADYNSATGVVTVYSTEVVKNATYKLTLVTATDGGEYRQAVSVKVANKLPAVTIKQAANFDLFLKDSTADITVTAKDAQITDVTFETSTFTSDYADGVVKVAYANQANPLEGYVNNKAVTKGNMVISFAGYRDGIAVTKSVTVKAKEVKPTLVQSLSATKLTYHNMNGAPITVSDKATKAVLDWSEYTVLRSQRQKAMQKSTLMAHC